MVRVVIKLVVFLTVLSLLSVLAAEEVGYLAGTAEDEKGKPLEGGYIYLFRASSVSQGQVRGRPTYVLGPIGAGGDFEFMVPAGSYYYTAVKRRDPSAKFGKPEEGDSVFFQHEIPLIIESGARISITIKTTKYKEMPDKDAAFIKGFVRDAQGNPVEGAIVKAFPVDKPATPMSGINATKKDGSYKLKVSAGKYFIRVLRQGNRPQDQKFVDVKQGKTVENINITIRKEEQS